MLWRLQTAKRTAIRASIQNVPSPRIVDVRFGGCVVVRSQRAWKALNAACYGNKIDFLVLIALGIVDDDATVEAGALRLLTDEISLLWMLWIELKNGASAACLKIDKNIAQPTEKR